jgi:hypothetical protein
MRGVDRMTDCIASARDMSLKMAVGAVLIIAVGVASASAPGQMPHKYVVSPDEFDACVTRAALPLDEAAIARELYDKYSTTVSEIEEARDSFLAWSSLPLTRDLQLSRYGPAASADGRRLDAHARQRLMVLESDLFQDLGLLSPRARDGLDQTLFARRRARAMPRTIPDLASEVALLALEDDAAQRLAFVVARYESEIDRDLRELEETELSDEWIERRTLAEQRRQSELVRVYENALEAQASVYRTTREWIPRIAGVMPADEARNFRLSSETALYADVLAIDILTHRVDRALIDVRDSARAHQLKMLSEEWNDVRFTLMSELRDLYDSCFSEAAAGEDASAIAAAQIAGEQPKMSEARSRYMEKAAGFRAIQSEYQSAFEEIVDQ